jgi:hypothetical protein
VVSADKGSAVAAQSDGKRRAVIITVELAGEPPAREADEPEAKRPPGGPDEDRYAILVVGLVMVLIGVLVMVANSHVTWDLRCQCPAAVMTVSHTITGSQASRFG